MNNITAIRFSRKIIQHLKFDFFSEENIAYNFINPSPSWREKYFHSLDQSFCLTLFGWKWHILQSDDLLLRLINFGGWPLLCLSFSSKHQIPGTFPFIVILVQTYPQTYTAKSIGTASLQWGKTPPHNNKKCSIYDTKQFDGELVVMMELWGIWKNPSLPSLPGPLWSYLWVK